MALLNAFIARSFAPQDEERIRPVLEFLDTFRKAGFICETADAAEVESVSKKVQRMIGEADVFIGFFTKRYPVYRFESRVKGVVQILFGSVKPEIWSAPAWVLQESGYALSAGKDLILLREPGVEVFGLQGDLEYIPFDSQKPAEVYPKLSQMVNDLLATKSGTEVKVIVTERLEQREVVVEQAVSEPKIEEPRAEKEEPDISQHYFEMGEAVEKQDFDGLDAAWLSGKALITTGEIKDFDMVDWDSLYFEKRFEMGAPDALENLRRLRAENSEHAMPVTAMARCLSASQEFEEAARLYLAAATLQVGPVKAQSLVRAARAFREAKQYKQGYETILNALPIATGDLRDEATGLQYELLKFTGKEYFAFAIAESSLHENPLLPIRFNLALDYHRKDLDELGLSHFKFLHEKNTKDSSSLHNLALLYSDCKLPVTSVERYKLAFSMGETLSAANLGFMYLDAGMADEAKTLVEQAMQVEEHVARVEKCLSEIPQRKELEKQKETELLEKAAASKSFLANLGRGLSAAAPPVNGNWKFPFGEMPLTLDSHRLTGTVVIKKEVSGFGALFGTPGREKVVRTDRYSLEGAMTGSVCEFELRIADVSGDLVTAIGLSYLAGPKSGFIVFASEGESAMYAELSDGKLGSPEKLSRVG